MTRAGRGVLVVIGAVAFAVSFAHTHDNFEAQGQGAWVAWALAVVVELLAIGFGLEYVARRRVGQSTALPLSGLLLGIGMMLWGNLETAGDGVGGIAAAAFAPVATLLIIWTLETTRGKSPKVARGTDQTAFTGGSSAPAEASTGASSRASGAPSRASTAAVDAPAESASTRPEDASNGARPGAQGASTARVQDASSGASRPARPRRPRLAPTDELAARRASRTRQPTAAERAVMAELGCSRSKAAAVLKQRREAADG